MVIDHENTPLGVIDHEKHRGGVHLVLGGDLGEVGVPRVPVQGHHAMQIFKYFTRCVKMAQYSKFEATQPRGDHDVVLGHGERLLSHIQEHFLLRLRS